MRESGELCAGCQNLVVGSHENGCVLIDSLDLVGVSISKGSCSSVCSSCIVGKRDATLGNVRLEGMVSGAAVTAAASARTAVIVNCILRTALFCRKRMM